jgi:hypothetical protein
MSTYSVFTIPAKDAPVEETLAVNECIVEPAKSSCQ